MVMYERSYLFNNWVRHLGSHPSLRQDQKCINRVVIGRVSLEYLIPTHHAKDINI